MLIDLSDRLGIIYDSLLNRRRYYLWEREIKSRVNDRRILTDDQIKEINLFWNRYRKIKVNAHAFYTEKTGHFASEYIPDSIWYGYIDPYYNPHGLAKAMDSKLLYSRLLPSKKIYHPHNIAYLVNGYWISEDYKPLTLEEVKRRILSKKVIFIKQAEESSGGHGVIYFDATQGGGGEKLAVLLSKLRSNVVIQEGLKQSKLMDRLNSSSINTLRILTHLTNEREVKVRSVIVRIGRRGAHVDNASSGGITIGVDNFGRLKSKAYDVKGHLYDAHPDANENFPKCVIPNFSYILDAILELHWCIPQFRLLSWDVAIDENDNPVLIEVNLYSGELDFHQLNNGPVFGDDTQSILGEVFHK